MKITPTDLPEVLIIEPVIFSDSRGFFMESFNQENFVKSTGLSTDFVQDNHSHSRHNVLRGLHYQLDKPQGKLVRVVRGEVFDVAVDIRKSSPRFGRWVGITLSGTNHRQLWVPPGFAHGFLVLSDTADFLYKTTEYYSAKHEHCIAWNCKELMIDWPSKGQSTLEVSVKDQLGVPLSKAAVFD